MRRLEPAAITGIMSREVANFRTFWKATTFSSVLEPIVYLLAFGLGLGATVVDRVDGLDYVEFVGTGMVATAVIFSSALPAMFGTFVKERFQRTYDAILAAPVDVEELVTAEMLWIGIRAGFYGCFPLLVTMLFGLDPAPGNSEVCGCHIHIQRSPGFERAFRKMQGFEVCILKIKSERVFRYLLLKVIISF
jgi:lipooligosaccharide transport system permease protein